MHLQSSNSTAPLLRPTTPTAEEREDELEDVTPLLDRFQERTKSQLRRDSPYNNINNKKKNRINKLDDIFRALATVTPPCFSPSPSPSPSPYRSFTPFTGGVFHSPHSGVLLNLKVDLSKTITNEELDEILKRLVEIEEQVTLKIEHQFLLATTALSSIKCHCPNITALSLSDCPHIFETEVNDIIFDELTTLDLTDVMINDHLWTFVSSQPKLRKLILSRPYSEEGAFARSNNNINIESLEIRNFRHDDFLILASFPKLERLAIDGSSLNTEDVLRFVEGHKALKGITLRSYPEIDDFEAFSNDLWTNHRVSLEVR